MEDNTVIKYHINDVGDVVKAIFEDDTQFWRHSNWKYGGNYSYYDTFEEAKKVQLKRAEYHIQQLQKEVDNITKNINVLESTKTRQQKLKEGECVVVKHGHMSAKPSHEFR